MKFFAWIGAIKWRLVCTVLATALVSVWYLVPEFRWWTNWIAVATAAGFYFARSFCRSKREAEKQATLYSGIFIACGVVILGLSLSLYGGLGLWSAGVAILSGVYFVVASILFKKTLEEIDLSHYQTPRGAGS